MHFSTHTSEGLSYFVCSLPGSVVFSRAPQCCVVSMAQITHAAVRSRWIIFSLSISSKLYPASPGDCVRTNTNSPICSRPSSKRSPIMYTYTVLLFPSLTVIGRRPRAADRRTFLQGAHSPPYVTVTIYCFTLLSLFKTERRHTRASHTCNTTY